MSKLITLSEWRQRNFEQPPTMDTVRKWCRDGNIVPAPKKIGRSFFLRPDAEYVQHDRSSNSLLDRIRAETTQKNYR